ncbi:hypothetical protein LWI29_004924 [Acer saccharum]|uniref:Uncharacterized protein n=1 Tax=Acer saccharum TaxID=4024 RepID=A0AA39TNK9_ACESA|nr:hypothetical protein LWI29_004924 [Acer saccharum]
MEGPEIQDPSFTNSPIDSPIHYHDTDTGASAGTCVFPEHGQPAVTILSTLAGLSPSLPIPFPVLAPTRPTIGEMLARVAKARGSSVHAPKQAPTVSLIGPPLMDSPSIPTPPTV